MSHWGDRGCRLPINCPMEIAQFLKTNPGAEHTIPNHTIPYHNGTDQPTNPRSRLPTIYARWQTWRDLSHVFPSKHSPCDDFLDECCFFFCRRNISWATKSLSSSFSSLPAKVILSYLSFSSIPADFYRQNCPFLLLDSKPAGSKWCRHTSSNKHLLHTISRGKHLFRYFFKILKLTDFREVWTSMSTK